MALDCQPAAFPAGGAVNSAPQGGDVPASMAPGIVGFPEANPASGIPPLMDAGSS